eukprot:Skav211232  [mRNA]  locus=scaffold180:24907:26768:- [translate_table: standard]
MRVPSDLVVTIDNSKILLGDLDGGVETAMQGVVLARGCGDKELEAYALLGGPSTRSAADASVGTAG